MAPSLPGGPEVPDDHGSWLRRRARRLLDPRLRRYADSEDVAQDVRAAAVDRAARAPFQGPEHLRRWLQRVLLHRIRDLARYAQPRRAEELSEHEAHGREPTASAHVRQAEAPREVERLLRGLSARERETVRLRIVEELSFAEIAERSGVSEGNARVLFHRAIQSLRERALREDESAHNRPES